MGFSSDGDVLYTAGADRTLYEIDATSARVIWGTVLPAPVIALLAEGPARLSAMDSGGNLYRFVNTSKQSASNPTRRSFLATIAACLRLGWGRLGCFADTEQAK